MDTMTRQMNEPRSKPWRIAIATAVVIAVGGVTYAIAGTNDDDLKQQIIEFCALNPAHPDCN